MSVAQPQPSDNLNNPSHSKLHRTIASDDAAPDQSLYVDGSSNMIVAEKIKDVAGDNEFTPETVEINELNIALLYFRLSTLKSLSIYNMVSGFVDEYEDETGVDTANCLNQLYDSTDDYYSPEIMGVDDYTKLLLNFNGVPGVYGATFFDGTGDYLSIPLSSDWDIVASATDDWTVDCWVKHTTHATTQAYFGQYEDTNNAWRIQHVDGVGTKFVCLSGGVKIIETGFGGEITDNEWHHIALIKVADLWSFYLDGNQVVYLQDSSTDTFTGPFYVAQDGGLVYPYNGHMKNLRISKSNIFSATPNVGKTNTITIPTTQPEADSTTLLLLKMDESVGDLAKGALDSSGFNNVVSYAGTAKIFRSSAYDETALYIDGNSDYLTVPDSSDWDFGTGEFTFETWVYFSSSVSGRLYNHVEGGGDGLYWYFSGGDLYLRSYYSAGYQINVNGTHSMLAGYWYHLAVDRDSSGDVRIYQDGRVLVTTNDASSTGTFAADLNIGRKQDGTDYIGGYLREYRISNVARYGGAFTPSTTAFTSDANTKLLLHLGTGTQFPNVIAGVADFNGSSQYLSTPYSTDWNILTQTNFTIDLWVKHTNYTGVETYVTQWEDGSNFWRLTHQDTTQGIRFEAENDGGGVVDSGSGAYIITDTNWHHVALCKVGDLYALYVDGTQYAYVSDSDTDTYSGGLYVGIRGDASSATAFDGEMKMLRIQHSNVFGAAPVVGLTDVIKVPINTTDYTVTTDTKLLLEFDGYPGDTDDTNGFLTDSGNTVHTISNNGSTPCLYPDAPNRHWTDEGNTGHAVSGFGTAKIDWMTVYDTGCLWLDGNSDYLTVPDSDDWDIVSSGNFTVECWARWDALSTHDNLIGQYQAVGSDAWYFGIISENTLRFYAERAAQPSLIAYDESWVPTLNTWYHLAVVRTGSNFQFYVNGLALGTGYTNSNYLNALSGSLAIGATNTGAHLLDGFMDEVRISNTARYSANFIPSISAYATDSNTLLLLHMDRNNLLDSSDSGHTPYGYGDTIQRGTISYQNVYNETWGLDSETIPKISTRFGDAAVSMGIRSEKLTAGYFNGSSDYISVPASTDWNIFASNADDWVLDFWIRFRTHGSTSYIFNQYVDGNNLWALRHDHTNGFDFWLYQTGYTVQLPQGGEIDDSYWHHVAMCKVADEYGLYVDGQQVSYVQTSSTGTLASSPLTIGRYNAGAGSLYVDGWLDEIRIQNSNILSAAPNDDLGDRITVPTTQPTSDSDTKLLLLMDAPSGATSPSNSVAWFDGNSDYLTIPDSSDWDCMSGTSDFTIELWANLNSLAANSRFLSNFVIASGASIQYYFNSTYGLHFRIDNNTNPDLLTFYEGSVTGWTVDTWYHLAVVRNGTNIALYKDGVSVASTTYSTSIDVKDSALEIGEYSLAGTFYMNGYIKEMRISDSARYTAEFAPSNTPFTSDVNTMLLLHFNGVPGDTTNANGWLTDSSTTGHTVTANGTAQCKYTNDYRNTNFIDSGDTGHLPVAYGTTKIDWISAFGDGSLSLNGSTDYITVPTSTDWDFGTGDFTVECWVKLRTVNDWKIWNPFNGTAEVLTVGYDASNNLIFRSENGTGTGIVTISTAYTLKTYTWYHIAAIRYGNVWSLYLDGLLIGTQTVAHTVVSSSTVLAIGKSSAGAGYFLDGFIDGHRVSKGIARWTANFIPPTYEYSADALNMTLQSFAQTAYSTPDDIRLIIFEEDVSAVTVNVDLLGYVSRDGGTSWTQVTLVDESSYESGKRVLSGIADASGQPSPSTFEVAYKLQTANNKDLKIHGVSVNW